MTGAVYETNFAGLVHRGKVRDTYDIGGGLLLIVATDRVSAFDAVMPQPIPQKGAILSRMSEFWFKQTRDIVPNHLIGLASDATAMARVPRSGALAELPDELADQAMVVRRASRIDIECVVRAYITGSAWAEYRRTCSVHGIPLPSGMKEAAAFQELLFTPTTKAENGHDEPLTMSQTEALIGREMTNKVRQAAFRVFTAAHDHARSRGIILADTKMEFGLIDGELTLIDELLTPDSSRFWLESDYRPGTSPAPLDKQILRDWLEQSGWNKQPPAPALPDDIVQKTRQRYLEALERLTGITLLKD